MNYFNVFQLSIHGVVTKCPINPPFLSLIQQPSSLFPIPFEDKICNLNSHECAGGHEDDDVDGQAEDGEVGVEE